jgi:hypothetical protein
MESFVSIVHDHFDDLAGRHSMQCAEESQFHVRYENSQVILGVGWDALRSFELGAGLKPKTNITYPSSFSLADILRFLGETSSANEIEALYVEAAQDLEASIKKLAALTRVYGHRFRDGDLEAYNALSEFMKTKTTEYNAQLSQLGSEVRAKYREGDAAWVSHDFVRVIEIYRTISPPFPPVVRERLAIAEKEVSGGSKE